MNNYQQAKIKGLAKLKKRFGLRDNTLGELFLSDFSNSIKEAVEKDEKERIIIELAKGCGCESHESEEEDRMCKIQNERFLKILENESRPR